MIICDQGGSWDYNPAGAAGVTCRLLVDPSNGAYPDDASRLIYLS